MPLRARSISNRGLRDGLFVFLVAAILGAWIAGLSGRAAVIDDQRSEILNHRTDRIATAVAAVVDQRQEALATVSDLLASDPLIRNAIVSAAAMLYPPTDTAEAAALRADPIGTAAVRQSVLDVLRDQWRILADLHDFRHLEIRLGAHQTAFLHLHRAVDLTDPLPADARPVDGWPLTADVAPASEIGTMRRAERLLGLESVSPVRDPGGGIVATIAVAEHISRVAREVARLTGAATAVVVREGPDPGLWNALTASRDESGNRILFQSTAFDPTVPLAQIGTPVWHLGGPFDATAIGSHPLPLDAIGSHRPFIVAQSDVAREEARLSDELSMDRVILSAIVMGALALVGALYAVVRRHDTSARDRDRLDFAMAASGEGLWEWDTGRDLVRLSPRWIEMFGTPWAPTDDPPEPGTSVTVSLQDLRSATHPADLPGLLHALDEHWQGTTDLYRASYRLRRGDGWVWVLDRGRIAARDRRGQVAWMIGTQADISDLQRARARLEAAERLHREMFERSTAPMLLVDRKSGAIRDANEAAYLFYGWSRSRLKRMHLTDLQALPTHEIERRKRQATIEGRPSYAAQHRRANGDLRNVAIHASPLTVDGVPYLFKIVHDITDEQTYLRNLRQREREVEDAHRETGAALHKALAANADLERMRLSAEQANHAKSEFLAAMSHDLRTPLNAILGFSDLLLAHLPNQTAEKTDEYLADINAAGRHLLELIDDLLDLSKIDAGRMEVSDDVIRPELILDQMTRLMQARFADHGLTLDRGVRNPDLLLSADVRMVRQMLLNLIGNAIKFTPDRGTVTVATGVAADGGITITIGDTGPGMSAEDLRAALEPFSSVNPDIARASEQKSTGLGLSLVTRMMQLHEGRLEIDTAPGAGLRATLRFPAERSSREPERRLHVVTDNRSGASATG